VGEVQQLLVEKDSYMERIREQALECVKKVTLSTMVEKKG